MFRDIDSLEPGADFPERIASSLTACGAFVVVIGREWLVDRSSTRRLENPQDWVRLELQAALDRNDVLVVPVLVEVASMPKADDLPDTLHPLARLNAMPLSDSRWDYDVERLTDVIDVATSSRREKAGPAAEAPECPRGGGPRPRDDGRRRRTCLGVLPLLDRPTTSTPAG